MQGRIAPPCDLVDDDIVMVDMMIMMGMMNKMMIMVR